MLIKGILFVKVPMHWYSRLSSAVAWLFSVHLYTKTAVLNGCVQF